MRDFNLSERLYKDSWLARYSPKRVIRRVKELTLKQAIKKAGIYLLLLSLSLLFVGPFLWLFSTALKSSSEAIMQFPPQFIPKNPTLKNFIHVWNVLNLDRFMLNSVLVTGFTVLLNVFLSAAAAYPLARMDFFGRDWIFYAILSTMMIPRQLTYIPLFILMNKIGLVNTYAGMILPFGVEAFGVFIMRQSYYSVPEDLENSARVDGANEFQIWWKVVLPLVKPGMAALGIFVFIGSWSRFLWPLIIAQDKSRYTLTVGLEFLQGFFTGNWRYIATGSVISVVPIILFFIFTQRFFIEGLSGALKQ